MSENFLRRPSFETPVASGERRKSSIDIRGRSIQADVLVALLDRPHEMQSLMQRNKAFYGALQNYIQETQGEKAWRDFHDILLSPREDIPDRAWIATLSVYLQHNPVFLTKFKESIGYDVEEAEEGSEDEDDSEDSMISMESDHMFPNQAHSEDDLEDAEIPPPPPRRKSLLSTHMMHPAATSPIRPMSGNYFHTSRRPILLLRDVPELQARLPVYYPEFFRRARAQMSMAPNASKLSRDARRNSILEEDADILVEEGDPRFNTCEQDHLDSFDRFVRAVCTTRRQQPDDNAWLQEVLESLEGWPDLLDELYDLGASLDERQDSEGARANVF
ncbi:hypothetical protein BCR43DRAFT_352748 [Syncephalastrum racemosum]|uniref:Uncharacterized protein n=1 Tax=Syncephalastrum racemosum TaxID=13706 RepID=A0A1X2H6C0_SYNRA|nr:hypothetical protein BCR43DRAFT_352748 [Syncephalastrum racemosum]